MVVPPAVPTKLEVPKQPKWMWPADKPTFGEPAWMHCTSGKRKTRWTDTLNHVAYGSRVNGDEWVLCLEQRWCPYYAAVIYPKAYISPRLKSGTPPGKDAPNDKMTLNDLLYEALGVKEVWEITAVPKWRAVAHNWCRIPKGGPSIPATCAGWGKLPGSLKTKNRESYVKRAQACYNFCFYNKQRIDEFRDVAKKVVALSKEKSTDKKLKKLAERIIRYAEGCEEFWEEEDEHFRKSVLKWAPKFPELISAEEAKTVSMDAKWFKRLRDYYVKVYDDWAEKDNAKAMKMISRGHWTGMGGTLDGTVWTQHRLVIRVAQEATIAGAASPEAREFALEVRGIVRNVMWGGHCKEGYNYRSWYVLNRGPRKR